jgi:hypothetical protein
MKKLLLCLIAIAGIVTVKAQADNASVKKETRRELKKAEGYKPTYQAKESFYSDFGDMEGVTWKQTANFDEAVFTKDGKTLLALLLIKLLLIYPQMPRHISTTNMLITPKAK